MAHEGDRAGARAVFQQIIHYEPDNEDAWLWLAWLAEDKRQGLEYLREAEMLLPGSARIAEAMRWLGAGLPAADVVSDSEGSAREAETPIGRRRAPQSQASAQAGAAVEGALAAAALAGKGATEALSRLREKAARVRLPQGTFERLRGLAVPVISLLAIGALAVFVMLGIARARNQTPVVRALSLPTPIADATSTPTVKQMTDPLWTQVDVAFTRQDWRAAANALRRIREVDPYNDKARKSLAVAHYQQGLELIKLNRLDDAQVELDWAIRLDAGYEPLQQIRRQLKLYLDAVESYWAQDWATVVQKLEKVYSLDPGFRDTQAMLAQAYYEYGVEKQNAEVWEEAQTNFKRALELNPAMSEAQNRLQVVNDALIPPRRIEVDLS
ncbi:MAG: hypothetical protein GX552_14945, partial [Chloroflexi bacterium]|nr:hypothetical protein [Chloroflexota bacterium]